jgi:hypothetical protein
MTRSARVTWVLALFSSSLGGLAVAADGALPPARRWVPKEAVVAVEVERPKALIDFLAGPKATTLVTSNPAYKAALAGPQLQGMIQLVRYLEMQTGTDWRSGLAKLLEGGATMALLPGGGLVLIVDSGDAAMLEKVHNVFLDGARGEAAKQGKPDPVESHNVQGVTTWSLAGTSVHAVLDRRLVWASTPAAFEAVLEHRTHADRAGLDSSAGYQAARKAVGSQAVATGYADVAVLKSIPQIDALVQPSDNPLTVLLMAGMKQAVKQSKWLGLGLRINGESLALDAFMDGKTGTTAAEAGFAAPPAGKGALPLLEVPRRLAGMSLYRDLNGFYSAKDQLFPERTSGIIFFENMMGIFFSGRDINSEVFAETRPEVQFVMAEQKFDPAVGTPDVKLPAFALVIPSKHPEEFGRVVEEAWQKAVGLISVTRGQQAEPGLIMDRVTHADVKFTVATNAAGKNDDKAHLPSRFNFSASMARVGDTFILSSTEGLARDLIDALKKTPSATAKPLVGTDSVVVAEGTQIGSILAANRETLVARNMVEKGNTRAKAEGEVDSYTTIVKLARRAQFTAGVRDGLSRYTLSVDLNLP